MSPKIFGEIVIAETPTTDPKTLIGRNLEINFTEIDSNSRNFHMKLAFKVTDISNDRAYTRFNGFNCTKDHLLRIVRKRSQKITLIKTFNTKDDWKLQITTTLILNRNTESTIRRKVRNEIATFLKSRLEKSTIDAFVKSITNNSLQKEIRKKINKIYPVRFSEIEKIEVLKAG